MKSRRVTMGQVSPMVWAVILLLGSACGGGTRTTGPSPSVTSSTPGPSSAASPPCSPSGTALRISLDRAKDALGTAAFDKSCLAAPANTPFTIRFRNIAFSSEHNLSIYTKDPQQDPNARLLFKGAFVGPRTTVTYQVPALPPGIYFFRDDFYTFTMIGTFVSS